MTKRGQYRPLVLETEEYERENGGHSAVGVGFVQGRVQCIDYKVQTLSQSLPKVKTIRSVFITPPPHYRS